MRSRSVLLAIAALAAFAAPAQAADHTATLSAATPKFEWEGAPEISRGSPVWNAETQALRQATPCDSGPLRPCETVHVQLAADGKFSIKATGTEGTGGTTDMDLYLHASDASGAQGDLITTTAAAGDETLTIAKAKAGYYLLVADYYHSYNSGYKGSMTLTTSAPPPPPAPAVPATPAAPSTPAQPAKKKASKRATCTKKAKKIKNKRKRAKALKRCKKIKG